MVPASRWICNGRPTRRQTSDWTRAPVKVNYMSELPLNRWIPLSLLFTLSTILLTGCPLTLVTGVTIPDEALESAIRAELNQPFGPLLEADLLTIRELEASDLNIRDLEGIQFVGNLITLDLSNNDIKSITELSGLGATLRSLDLGRNEIDDITPLAGLFALNFLNLDLNPILDWSPLVNNVSSGGFFEGGVIIVGEETVTDESTSSGFTPSFQRLVDAAPDGVDLQVLGPDTSS